MSFNVAAIEKAFLTAAVDPDSWNAAMDVCAQATQSFGAIVIPFPRGSQPFLPTSMRMAPCIDTYIRDGWYARDERERALPRIRAKRVAVDFDVMPMDEMRKSPFYQEALAPFGLRWFAGVRVMAGDEFWCLAIQRDQSQLPFSAEEQQQLEGLSDKLSTAATLARALGNARAEAALNAFDVSATAAIMIDREAKAIRWNNAAQKLCGQDLQIKHGRLVLADRDAALALDHALHALLWNPSPSVLAAPVLIRRRQGASVLAYPLRLEGVSQEALAPCRGMIVLRDLGGSIRPSEEAVRIAFRLTAAEARLATRVAAGETVADIASQLGIATQTARNQLKSIFAKTGAERQADLVALLAQFLPGP